MKLMFLSESLCEEPPNYCYENDQLSVLASHFECSFFKSPHLQLRTYLNSSQILITLFE